MHFKITHINIQGLLNIPVLEVASVRVTTKLSMSLFDDIQKHGEGKIPPTYLSHIVCPFSHCIQLGTLTTSLKWVEILEDSPKQVIAHVLYLMKLNQILEMVTTLAGSSFGLKDGKGLDASLNGPWGICMNQHDQCLYICDRSNISIRKLTMKGSSRFKITLLHYLWTNIILIIY